MIEVLSSDNMRHYADKFSNKTICGVSVLFIVSEYDKKHFKFCPICERQNKKTKMLQET